MGVLLFSCDLHRDSDLHNSVMSQQCCGPGGNLAMPENINLSISGSYLLFAGAYRSADRSSTAYLPFDLSLKKSGLSLMTAYKTRSGLVLSFCLSLLLLHDGRCMCH